MDNTLACEAGNIGSILIRGTTHLSPYILIGIGASSFVLDKYSMSDSCNKCTIPFTGYTIIHIDTKKITPCCKVDAELLNDKTLTDRHMQLRQDIINNKKSNLCSRCWDIEDNGGMSFRKIWSSHELVDWSGLRIDQSILNIEFKISNKCQLQCAYCGPDASSMWQESVPLWPVKGILPIIDISNQLNIHNLLNINTLRKIKITGGEPMLEQKCIDFLLELPFDKNRELSIITNLSYGKNVFDKLMQIINRHPNITVICSLDSVGKNISRKYLKWELWESNYKSLLGSLQTRLIYEDATLRTLITVSILNYSKLTEVIQYHLEYRKLGYRNTNFLLNYIALNEILSMNSAELDKTQTIKLADEYILLLSNVEKLEVEKFNELMSNVEVNKSLSETTSEFLDRYLPL